MYVLATLQIVFSGTVVQLVLAITNAYAFMSPKPKRELNQNPAAFLNQPGFSLEIYAIIRAHLEEELIAAARKASVKEKRKLFCLGFFLSLLFVKIFIIIVKYNNIWKRKPRQLYSRSHFLHFVGYHDFICHSHSHLSFDWDLFLLMDRGNLSLVHFMWIAVENNVTAFSLKNKNAVLQTDTIL